MIVDGLNNFMDGIKCILFGTCKIDKYEYSMYLNDKKIKADDCFFNHFGKTQCILNGVTYENIAIEGIHIENVTVKTDGIISTYGSKILVIVGIWLLFKILWIQLSKKKD